MSLYSDFVKAHVRNAPGATQRDRMRAVAAAWQKQKGKQSGKGVEDEPKAMEEKPTTSASSVPPPEPPAPATEATASADANVGDSEIKKGKGLKRVYKKRATPRKQRGGAVKKRELVEEAEAEGGKGAVQMGFKGGQMQLGSFHGGSIDRLGAGNSLGGFSNMLGHVGYGMKLPAEPLGEQEGQGMMDSVIGGALSWR